MADYVSSDSRLTLPPVVVVQLSPPLTDIVAAAPQLPVTKRVGSSWHTSDPHPENEFE